MDADLLIHSAEQIVTCAGASAAPKRRAALRDAGVLSDGAVAIANGRIIAVGPSTQVRAGVRAAREIDARGCVVAPGFIDPHTHLVFAGDRVAEFEMRIQGATYLEIMAAGGGIVSTMRATRAAGVDALVAQSRPRLDEMLRNGVTTCEIKTGYGLSPDAELDMLRAIDALARGHPCDVLPTLLAAHAVPPEYRGRADAYVDEVVNTIIPRAAAWFDGHGRAGLDAPLACDVFCETHAFTVEQARRVLQAGMRHGLRPKIHVDQFTSLGGVGMALALGALSCDHLEVTSQDDRTRLAQSAAVAVLLPAVTFNLGGTQFADARAMIDEGCAVALSTDMNPGSAPCLSPALVMAIACRYQKLSPAEAMNACTINAAHALGIAGSVGSIEVGKQADLLIIGAPDYRHLAYQLGTNLVRRVIKRGRVVAGDGA